MVYLAIQQVILPFHHGFAVKKNIVAKIRTISHLERLPVDGADYKMIANKLTLKFEGFVDLKAER